jgi:Zn-dependent metalloprotease
VSKLGPRTRSKLAAATAAAAALATLVLGLPSGAASAPTPAAKPNGDRVAEKAIASLKEHPLVARATPGQEFQATATIRDANGATHVRVQRSYLGLPVIGGDLVVHQGPDAAWDGVSQTLAAPVRVSVRPTVGKARAERAVTATDRVTRSIRKLRVEGAPRLVVDAVAGAPRLAWEFTTGGRRTDGTPSRLLTYVDARTGDVIRREERIQTTDGEGSSLYSGTVDLEVTPSGTSYLLKDPTRGNTYTTDFGNKTDGLLCQLFGSGCKPGTTFSSTDTFFGNGSTSSRESAGVDAQYGTNVTWDYYQQVHGRNGIFGNGTGSFNRVHYGNGYVNAFWDGTKMTYGDGDGVSYGPLVSLDVAGHEMSHGVTENTAALTYSGEPGGLNEATSDIFGTMVEFYAANTNDPADYYIGEEFDLAQHDGFRRMDNPSLDGNSHSCWSTTTKNVDVHYSSGVGNHFFYLLAEGSGAKTIGNKAHNSPTCNGSTITGIGRSDAERIWFRALTVYMTSGTTYAGARTAMLNAATDLFGAGSVQRATVAAAWSAVNVN